MTPVEMLSCLSASLKSTCQEPRDTRNWRNFKVFLCPLSQHSGPSSEFKYVIEIDNAWYSLTSGGQFALLRASGLAAAYLPKTLDCKPHEDCFVNYEVPST